ncbi:TPA: hypothetical protein OUE07_003020 [Citrobacter koseri]|nr:hypothetical protein [Citrobacter koseri]HCR3978383.1 hypothetical protein [Citrobacter koseri]HCU0189728.1 hypothetical protein [Citrobacter koseri]
MKIEVSKVDDRVCLLISPITLTIADRLAAAYESREVIAAFGTSVTNITKTPGSELVSLGLYFNHLDTAVFVTLNHLIKADKPIPIVFR